MCCTRALHETTDKDDDGGGDDDDVVTSITFTGRLFSSLIWSDNDNFSVSISFAIDDDDDDCGDGIFAADAADDVSDEIDNGSANKIGDSLRFLPFDSLENAVKDFVGVVDISCEMFALNLFSLLQAIGLFTLAWWRLEFRLLASIVVSEHKRPKQPNLFIFIELLLKFCTVLFESGSICDEDDNIVVDGGEDCDDVDVDGDLPRRFFDCFKNRFDLLRYCCFCWSSFVIEEADDDS